jgi:SAM-dependent methyltransferase
VAPGLAPGAERLMWRSLYELASMRRWDLGPPIMNYGYAALAASEAEPAPLGYYDGESYGLQLYAAVASGADLAGKDVLEVGCGRGGGAAFVFEAFRPGSMVGLDVARTAIDRCRRRYARPGLRFVAGDAEKLPFPDASFDAVLSVESSHCYVDPLAFLREVHRVLRPGGRLLLADLRRTMLTPGTESALFAQDDVGRLRQQCTAAGFETVVEEDITANVVRALELDTPARKARIERRIPKFLQPHVLAFAGVEGSPVHRAFVEAKLTYLRLALDTGSMTSTRRLT